MERVCDATRTPSGSSLSLSGRSACFSSATCSLCPANALCSFGPCPVAPAAYLLPLDGACHEATNARGAGGRSCRGGREQAHQRGISTQPFVTLTEPELMDLMSQGVQNLVRCPPAVFGLCSCLCYRKKNAPYLYDVVITHALDWPSLTCQWFPDKESYVCIECFNTPNHLR